jgi:hypothetical protein
MFIIRINDVVYRIQRHTRSRMMVVHLDRLAPFLGVLGTISPKEGAMLHIGFSLVTWPMHPVEFP